MIWPFKSAEQKRREEAEFNAQRRAYREREAAKQHAKSPAGQAQARFRAAMNGAPSSIVQLFNEVDEFCNPKASDDIGMEDVIRLALSIKDGSFKNAMLSNSGGYADSMAFYSGLTTTFHAVLALLPEKDRRLPVRSNDAGMTADLRDIDGAFLAQTIISAMQNVEMAEPLVTPLMNNQMLFHNLAHAKKQPKERYQISKLLLAGTPFSRLPDLRIPF